MHSRLNPTGACCLLRARGSSDGRHTWGPKVPTSRARHLGPNAIGATRPSPLCLLRRAGSQRRLSPRSLRLLVAQSLTCLGSSFLERWRLDTRAYPLGFAPSGRATRGHCCSTLCPTAWRRHGRRRLLLLPFACVRSVCSASANSLLFHASASSPSQVCSLAIGCSSPIACIRSTLNFVLGLPPYGRQRHRGSPCVRRGEELRCYAFLCKRLADCPLAPPPLRASGTNLNIRSLQKCHA